MEQIDFLTPITSHIDIICVVLVILGGYFSKRYLKNVNLSSEVKTLLVGTLFMAAYIMVLYLSGNLVKEDYVKYFVSYCVATSLYELILKRFKSGIK